MQKTICVDFDGVIADYSKGFQGRDVFGEPLHGAGASMGALKGDGWRVIIFTTRPDTPALRQYLRENAIPYDFINENPDQPEGSNPGKPIADIYLDDRAFRFKGWADFRYALDAMVQEKVLESAASGDWQALKQLFEKPKPPFVLEGAITPDAALLDEWFEKIWPQYKSEGYSKEEIQGYIDSGNWNADHLRNDLADYEKAQADDSPGIALGDSAGEAARLGAVNGIRKAKDFQTFAEWFASAFNVGTSGLLHWGLSDAARNIDAIYRLVRKYLDLKAAFDAQTGDIDDRLELAREINALVNTTPVKLDNGTSLSASVIEKTTGVELNPVKPPISGNDYADLKLSQYRSKAAAVMAAVGADFDAARRRIAGIKAEMESALNELNAKTAPLLDAYTARLDAAEESTGYNAKKKEAVEVIDKYTALRAELAKKKPADFTYFRGSTAQDQQDYVARYNAWSDEMQGLHDAQAAEIKAIQAELAALYDEACKIAGDLQEELKPYNEPYNAWVAGKRAEIAAEQAVVKKLRDHVLDTSPVSQETAEKWFAEMVLVTPNMMNNLKKRGYDPEKLKREMTEFHRMTGGRLSRVSFETRGGQRAAAQPTTGVVYVAGEFSTTTLWHELAHILEDDERTKATANRFLDQRTGRDQEGKNKVEWLGSLTGNPRYKRDEVAYKDSFIDPYVGKYYRDGITEVFSMGMQYFTSPESMAVLLDKDPDHFNFMLGYMATAPRIDKAKVAQQQAAMTEKKDTLQTSAEFLKDLDKKITKAGDFWSREGLKLDSYKSYRGGSRHYAEFPPDENGRIKTTPYVKSEKNLKRMLWLWIAAGKPETGDYSLSQLGYSAFGGKSADISKKFIDGIKGAL